MKELFIQAIIEATTLVNVGKSEDNIKKTIREKIDTMSDEAVMVWAKMLCDREEFSSLGFSEEFREIIEGSRPLPQNPRQRAKDLSISLLSFAGERGRKNCVASKHVFGTRHTKNRGDATLLQEQSFLASVARATEFYHQWELLIEAHDGRNFLMRKSS